MNPTDIYLGVGMFIAIVLALVFVLCSPSPSWSQLATSKSLLMVILIKRLLHLLAESY